MQVKCPSCSKALNVPSHLIGKALKCPCGNALKTGSVSNEPSSASAGNYQISCPNCGAKRSLPANVVGKDVQIKCTCGHALSAVSAQKPLAPTPINESQKSDGSSGSLNPNPGTSVLVISIAGLLFGPILLPIAWLMGNSYLASSKRQGYLPGGSGRTGRLIGKIFTIIWLLLAIPVLALGGFAALNARSVGQKANEAATDAQIRLLKSNIDMYHLRFNTTPESLNELRDGPSDPELQLLWTRPIITKIPKDAWGNSIVYSTSGNEYELRSSGADGTPETKDDIVIVVNR